MDEDALVKRVGVTVSKLKADKEIKMRLDGKKGLYTL